MNGKQSVFELVYVDVTDLLDYTMCIYDVRIKHERLFLPGTVLHYCILYKNLIFILQSSLYNASH